MAIITDKDPEEGVGAISSDVGGRFDRSSMPILSAGILKLFFQKTSL